MSARSTQMFEDDGRASRRVRPRGSGSGEPVMHADTLWTIPSYVIPLDDDRALDALLGVSPDRGVDHSERRLLDEARQAPTRPGGASRDVPHPGGTAHRRRRAALVPDVLGDAASWVQPHLTPSDVARPAAAVPRTTPMGWQPAVTVTANVSVRSRRHPSARATTDDWDDLDEMHEGGGVWSRTGSAASAPSSSTRRTSRGSIRRPSSVGPSTGDEFAASGIGLRSVVIALLILAVLGFVAQKVNSPEGLPGLRAPAQMDQGLLEPADGASSEQTTTEGSVKARP